MPDLEGLQYNGDNRQQILEFIRPKIKISLDYEEESPKKLIINTADDEHHLEIGSWILKWEEQMGISLEYKYVFLVCNAFMVRIFLEEKK
jgi:adenosine/AMP kinase